MRKLILFMMVTLDGYFEDTAKTLDWHRTDEEFNTFAIDQIAAVDTIVFGRVTYEGMASYWPTPAAEADAPEITHLMNTMPKIVVSTTLDRADWHNTRLIKRDVAAEFRRLKQQPGKDLIIFGSSNLATSLAAEGLIDEYRVIVNPVVLGSGTPFLSGIRERLNLTLTRSTTFANGNVLLYLRPAA